MNTEKIVAIFNILNQVQVSGYQNLKLLTASMQMLEDYIKEMQETAE